MGSNHSQKTTTSTTSGHQRKGKPRRPNKHLQKGTSLTPLAEQLQEQHLVFLSSKTVLRRYQELVKKTAMFDWEEMKDEYGNLVVTEDSQALHEAIMMQIGAIEDVNYVKKALAGNIQDATTGEVASFYDLVAERLLVQYPKDEDEPRRRTILDTLDEQVQFRGFVLLAGIKTIVEYGLERIELLDDYPVRLALLNQLYSGVCGWTEAVLDLTKQDDDK